MRILAVGIATLDIISVLESYPEEDSEQRALSQEYRRGGNATNTLEVLQRLGHDVAWAGNLASDQASQQVRSELEALQIDLELVQSVTAGRLPVSCIVRSRKTASRTIVHFRDLEEYPAERFTGIDPQCYDWIHFEGRNVGELKKMMQYLLEREFRNFSMEVEKPRESIESLFIMPAMMMFSRQYVAARHASVKDFFADLRQQGVKADLFCAWGKAGAWAMGQDDILLQHPSWQPAELVDTLGAGDTFNAALLHARLNGSNVEHCLAFACYLAGYKCGLNGFAGIEKAVADGA